MSARIQFKDDELLALWHLVSEAREGLDEEATTDELRLYRTITVKITAARRRSKGNKSPKRVIKSIDANAEN